MDAHRALVRGYEREADEPATCHSHFEQGRYENTYIRREAIPEVEPLLRKAMRLAKKQVGDQASRCGFWFNAMQPGERTARHNHQEDDELLSGVYYLETPDNCGDLLIYHREGLARIKPTAGQLVLFSPKLVHEVETNQAQTRRLSIAFNFGPET